jgi:ATP/maltotriose-dependent transcriptional regulator MalT
MTPAHIPRLTTKLTPPAAAPHQLTRHPAGLDAPTAARVVLVRAPAGFGKSTAMMQCHRALEARGQTVAWLTLDALDNDLSRFLHYLGEMMVQAGIASAPPRSPVEAVDAIAAHPSAFTFFMDELDTLRDVGVLGLLRELIERLPRGGQLVVGCRGWPDLGLGRLRARGQLVEVGPAQLRFSLEETRAFLRNRDAQLPEHALVTLHNRCEGWATGLWLASLALQRRRDTVALAESFSGSDQALAEYLAEDVLAHEPPEVREFLLRTSVLKQLTAPVCAALCPQTDCAAMLEHLATHGVFLTRIGDAPPTWRYHSLFASFLHARGRRCASCTLPLRMPTRPRAAPCPPSTTPSSRRTMRAPSRCWPRTPKPSWSRGGCACSTAGSRPSARPRCRATSGSRTWRCGPPASRAAPSRRWRRWAAATRAPPRAKQRTTSRCAPCCWRCRTAMPTPTPSASRRWRRCPRNCRSPTARC